LIASVKSEHRRVGSLRPSLDRRMIRCDARADRRTLLASAQPNNPVYKREAAGAANEGGFIGLHAVRGSEDEQRMLDELAEDPGCAALSRPPAAAKPGPC
jgi:hypothetical protein